MTKFKDKMNSYKKHPGSFLLFLLVVAAAIITVAVLLYLVAYILIHGVPYLKPGLFALEYNSDNVSMLPAMINTLEMTLFSLLFAVPLGIGAAVYLVEYAPKGSKLVKVVRITAETLTGIPSIIYGLFGMLFFVTYLHWGYSMLAGAATLAIMVLPVIMRTTEEALLCVPDTYREGSFWIGSRKTSYGIPYRSSICNAGNLIRNHPGSRANCRRDRSTDLYCRNGSRPCTEPDGIRTNFGRSYVFTFQRGLTYQ